MSLSRSLDAGPPAVARTVGTHVADGVRNATAVRARLDSIDLLRGLVMLLMALDHTRDFFGASGANPRDVAEPALFLTRWITHYCAPTFIFLAGISAWLYGARGRTTAELSRFLLTRGLFLILLEFTIIRFGWTFSLLSTNFLAQVIWAIGMSMVVLAGLVYLPRALVAIFALALIGGHNLLDGIRPDMLGSASWLWTILHQQGLLRLGSGVSVYVLYPLIPWIGVMAAGYVLGPVFQWDAERRRRLLLGFGAAVTSGFVLLRASNLYGDPAAWQVQDSALATVLSFINCEKYPPSLLYLMMTIGPALMLLAVFEGVSGRLAEWIKVYGRVPLMFYVAHIYLLHILAGVMILATYTDVSWMFADGPPRKPADYGLSLLGIYAIWLLALAMLWPLCRWFAALKARRREWWLSYL
jgi:uncharacterized membrane protein